MSHKQQPPSLVQAPLLLDRWLGFRPISLHYSNLLSNDHNSLQVQDNHRIVCHLPK